MKRIIYIVIIILLITACGGNNQTKSKKYVVESYDYTSDLSEDLETYDEYGALSIPFKEKGGIKTVFVKINGVGYDMIFDTGCSVTLISSAEAGYMIQKGTLTEDDIIGTSESMIADGSIVEDTVIILREVEIGDGLKCRNVIATVSDSANAPLLLGNEVLNQTASYTIDNVNKVIRFKLK